jgi:hypothetical protein
MYMNVNEDNKKRRLVSLRQIKLMGKPGIIKNSWGIANEEHVYLVSESSVETDCLVQ